MKTYFKYIFLGLAFSLFLTGCEGDETYFGETIFNDDTNFPYVGIFDLNEDLEGITGNNFWGFELTPTEDGNAVEIRYDSQDPNIETHEIRFGFEAAPTTNCGAATFASPEVAFSLQTINIFPSDVTITQELIANAAGITVEDLQGETVWFSGTSIDNDNNVVDNTENFEDFLKCERHAYLYFWEIN